MSKKILFITTSCSTMGNTGKPTGIWAEELVTPYYLFLDAGMTVEFASPLGGSVSFDPGSLKAKGENSPGVERFLADNVAQQKIKATAATATVNVNQFDAVFFPGGHGTMWDLPNDAHVTAIVEQAYTGGKLIAAVCHGPAGLVSAKTTDGKSILAGKRINSFTDEEESAAGLSDVVPFALESRIRSLGAKFEKAANWSEFAVRDGQLITGQNPQSSAMVARLVLTALGEKKSVAA